MIRDRSGLWLPSRDARAPLIAGGGIDNPFSQAPRNLYVPNGFDVWGWYGSHPMLASAAAAANTNTFAPLREYNAPAGGYLGAIGAAGTLTTITQNTGTTPDRPFSLRFLTTALADYATMIGGLVAGSRFGHGWPPTNLPNGYTKWQIEGVFTLSAVTNASWFIGFSGDFTNPFTTTVAVGSSGYGLGFESGDANLSIVRNALGTISKTTVVAVAANTVYKYLLTFDGTTLTAVINGTTVTATTGLPAQDAFTANSRPVVTLRGTAAGSVSAFSEWHIERMI